MILDNVLALILLLPGYYNAIQKCICDAYLDRENAATGFLPSVLACLNPSAKRSTSSSAISLLSGLIDRIASYG